ncbi:hypothetical protein H2O64_05660 [Kordia sp. YSTF-M3]|uniref:Natural product n=1 Tax=Kordia aestuariivivens TaxID=2759037 RepID=A0ABR7Q6T7_9FLAO|nr:hypothetical protein [Kordia aestuariivivens]MBC8754148.1 hypothetical protein [Kordia aestuariivivens]
MKKKKLKSLSLKKASVSKLNGGTSGPVPIQLTINIKQCQFTWDIYQCTWYSELYTACECQPTWDLTCTPA